MDTQIVISGDSADSIASALQQLQELDASPGTSLCALQPVLLDLIEQARTTERPQRRDGVRFCREAAHATGSVEVRPGPDRSCLILLTPAQDSAVREAEARNAALRAQLLESRSLAALGTLAAGIAHELNQSLTTIELTASLLDRAEDTNDHTRAEMERILTACRRMSRIVSNVRSFGRKEPSRRQPIRAHQPIDDALVLMGSQLAVYQVTTERQVSGDYSLSADRGRLQQVFVNLIANAMDVLRCCALPRRIRLRVTRAADAVVFAVEDNGPGVPEALREEIFAPFYSRRATGDGVGLGLALCRTIASEHDGAISCQASSLGGARFELRLPHPEPQ